MPEIQHADVLGNYLGNYRQAQQYGQQQQDRAFNQQRVMKQDERADMQFEQQYSAGQLDAALKRGQVLSNALGSVRDGDEQGFLSAKQQLIQDLQAGPEEAAKIMATPISRLPALREQSGLEMKKLEIALKRAQIGATKANTAQSYAAADASRATAAGGGEASLPPQTLSFMADQYLAGDRSVLTNLGRGAQGAKNIVALRTMIAQKATENGLKPNEVASIIGEFEGYKAGQRVLGGRVANMGMAVNEAYQMADLVTTASANVSRSKFIPVNMALQAWQRNTGSPEQVRFGASLNSFINAYARAISPVGTPTVSDKEHAREMLETAQSHEQVTAVIAQLKQEMEAAQRAPGMTQKEMRSTFRGEQHGATPHPRTGQPPSPLDAADAIVGIKR